ncbi:MAG: putative transporter, periplasmic substrate-binding protein [Hyphomicrobiales bacterium]|nr:putative transporter, periplasmic substrate-binding protein [Hyphomicrobiales bacterium]
MRMSAGWLRSVMRFSFALTIGLTAMQTSSAAASEIRVYSGGAPQETLEMLRADFEKRTGHKLAFTFAHVSVIQKKLAAGEKADVVLLPTPLMKATDQAIGLRAEGRAELARIGIGVLIKEGAPRPDVSSADAVRKLLREARAIAVPQPDGITGSHLMRMMDKLGVADEVRGKLKHKPAVDGAGNMVASGEADVGLYLASEVLSIKGAVLAGFLPQELQNYVVYSVGIPAANTTPEPALLFVNFIEDASNRESWKATGFELLDVKK